ncbi:MAG: hypothetical protein D6812_16450 [Deltaproteobacteria bacterium]|nr:MAG: hypothetical protein D6812_16450 [Deltaproteobacteria bacterium]
MAVKVGILTGSFRAFSEALILAIDARGGGEVTAEFCRIGGIVAEANTPYRVVIDRISHDIPFYREYLRHAALRGAYVINNPFRMQPDKFGGYTLCGKLGLRIPPTVALPPKAYRPGVQPEDLTNLVYPLPWEAIVSHVGFPAVMRSASGFGPAHLVNDFAEMMRVYDASGTETMILQRFIAPQRYLRCFVFGQRFARPVVFNLERQAYLPEEELPPDLAEAVTTSALRLTRALGYDMNIVEFSVQDDVPYLIDFVNLVSDLSPIVLPESLFEWAVERMAESVIDYARAGARTPFATSTLPEASGEEQTQETAKKSTRKKTTSRKRTSKRNDAPKS